MKRKHERKKKQQNKRRGPTPPLPPKKKSNGEGMVVAMQQFASAFADASQKEFFHLSSAMTKAKKTEIYVGASCGQKVKVLQWVKCSPPSIHIAGLYRSILEQTKALKVTDTFTVTLEATHHGPYSEIPTCFVEIGSREKEWSNREAGHMWSQALGRYFGLPSKTIVGEEYIAVGEVTAIDTMLHATKPESTAVCVVGIGGGHYTPKMNDLGKLKNIFLGHAITTYALQAHVDQEFDKDVNEEKRLSQEKQIPGGWKTIIAEAIKSTRISFPCTKIVCLVDKKAFKAAPRSAITDYLTNDLKIDWVFSKKEIINMCSKSVVEI